MLFRSRRIALVVTAAAVLAASLAAGASATTEPVLPLVIKVQLSKDTVAMDVKKVQRGTVAKIAIRNGSAVARVFTIGGLKVTVRARSNEIMFIAFQERGKYPYKSVAGATVHKGFLQVV